MLQERSLFFGSCDPSSVISVMPEDQSLTLTVISGRLWVAEDFEHRVPVASFARGECDIDPISFRAESVERGRISPYQ